MKKYGAMLVMVLVSINIHAMFDLKKEEPKAWRIAKLFYKYPDGYGEDDESKRESKSHMDTFLLSFDAINALVRNNLECLKKSAFSIKLKKSDEDEISLFDFFSFIENEKCSIALWKTEHLERAQNDLGAKRNNKAWLNFFCFFNCDAAREKSIREILNVHLQGKGEKYFIFSFLKKFKKIACSYQNFDQKNDFIDKEIKNKFLDLLHMDNCFKCDEEMSYSLFVKKDALLRGDKDYRIKDMKLNSFWLMSCYLNDRMDEDCWQAVKNRRKHGKGEYPLMKWKYKKTKGIKTDVINFKLWLQLIVARLLEKEGYDFIYELYGLLYYLDLSSQGEGVDDLEKDNSISIETIMNMKKFKADYDFSLIVDLLRSVEKGACCIQFDEKNMKQWQDAPSVLKSDESITSVKIDIADNPRGRLRKICDSLLENVPLAIGLLFPDATMYCMKDVLLNFAGDKKKAVVDVFVSSALINYVLIYYAFPLLGNLHSDVAWLKVFFENKVRKNIKQGVAFAVVNAFQWLLAYIGNVLISRRIFRLEVVGYLVHGARIPFYLLALWLSTWKKPVDRGAPDPQKGSRPYTLGDLKC